MKELNDPFDETKSEVTPKQKKDYLGMIAEWWDDHLWDIKHQAKNTLVGLVVISVCALVMWLCVTYPAVFIIGLIIGMAWVIGWFISDI